MQERQRGKNKLTETLALCLNITVAVIKKRDLKLLVFLMRRFIPKAKMKSSKRNARLRVCVALSGTYQSVVFN